MVAAQSNGSAQGRKPSRRAERIFAFKVLYGLLFLKEVKERDLIRAFMVSPDRPETLDRESSYAWALCKGVWEQRTRQDKSPVSLSQNWRLELLSQVHNPFLRTALFEMMSA